MIDSLESAALQALDKAVQLDPTNVLAWDNMAKLLMAAGRLADAEAAWRAALKVKPADAQLRTALGAPPTSVYRPNATGEVSRLGVAWHDPAIFDAVAAGTVWWPGAK